MEAFLGICKAIESSPLKFIKGDCRLLHLVNNEWDGCLEGEDFFTGFPPETRTISFAVGNEFLGDLVVEKQDLNTSRTDDEDNLSMSFDIRKDGLCLIIHLYCESKFPGCNEFARFVAYTTIQPSV